MTCGIARELWWMNQEFSSVNIMSTSCQHHANIKMMMTNIIMNKNTLQGEIHYLLCLFFMLAC
jgi:hypothetical protein